PPRPRPSRPPPAAPSPPGTVAGDRPPGVHHRRRGLVGTFLLRRAAVRPAPHSTRTAPAEHLARLLTDFPRHRAGIRPGPPRRPCDREPPPSAGPVPPGTFRPRPGPPRARRGR